MTFMDILDKHPWFVTLWLLIVCLAVVHLRESARGSCGDCGIENDKAAKNEGDSGERE